MSWQKWVLVAWLILEAVVTVATIGRARQVITPRIATGTLVISTTLILLVVTA